MFLVAKSEPIGGDYDYDDDDDDDDDNDDNARQPAIRRSHLRVESNMAGMRLAG